MLRLPTTCGASAALAALAYSRAYRLNYNAVEGPDYRFGIFASGKAYNGTRQALLDRTLGGSTEAANIVPDAGER